MLYLALGVFAVVIIVLDQITKYLTVAGIPLGEEADNGACTDGGSQQHKNLAPGWFPVNRRHFNHLPVSIRREVLLHTGNELQPCVFFFR